HSRTGATHDFDDEDELERQLDYETDANTEYNAALLSANIRPQGLPPVETLPPRDIKGKGKSREKDRGKDKDKAASRARRQQRADMERRMRRREQGIDSDTTQGDDTDDGEYVTGYGSSRRRSFKPPPAAHQQPPTSSSMPNIPPTTSHPYVSPAGQYGYPPQQQQGYGQQQQPGYGYSEYAVQPAMTYGATPQQYGTTPGSGGGYFSPSAPSSAQFPNLFASTDPRKNSSDPARQAAEEAGRRKLRENPLPGLPGQGGSGGISGLPGGGGISGLPGGGGISGLPGGGISGLPGGGGMSGLPGGGGMSGLPGGGGMSGMPTGPQLMGPPVGSGGLDPRGPIPGGYGGTTSSREKSKSKGHGKAASTGTLPAQSIFAQYAPPTRAPKTSDPPPTIPSKSSK
ncbi:hypothetical protein FRC07_013625, partial [Ceratobasidium sp. 392]